ncbi:hypothetical protein ACFV1L_06025 [Kitasatospora sp. NPDC059646]|uniref:hypothetical protein n=1 Tax=Kitasatospora sp. NPDC059646 TaxID=3346893 RepID=UPI0036BB69E4
MLYPTYYDRGTGHGPDRLCDDGGCFCMRHECDCDVCREVLNVPGLKVLMDSQEGEKTPKEKIVTAGRIEMHLHAALRKHITDYLTPDTDDHHDLITACKELRMGRSNNSTTVWVTNGALGVALEIARGWLNDGNNSRVVAAKTTLIRHELDYIPEDPRERRFEFKMPASIGRSISEQYWQLKDDPETLADLKACAWSSTGGTGRVRPEALRWLLKQAEAATRQDASAPQRAGRKFLETYGPVYAEALREITEFEAGNAEPKPSAVESAVEQTPELVWEWLHELTSGQQVWFGGDDQGGAAAPQLVTVKRSISHIHLSVGDTVVHAASLYSKAWWALADQGQKKPEEDEIQAPGPEPVRHWESVTVSSVSGRGYVYYGGPAKGPCDQGGPLVLVRWRRGSGGHNDLVDISTCEVLTTLHSNTRIWAASKANGGQVAKDPAEAEQPKHEPELEVSEPEWRNTELRELPYRLRGQKARILYGGRADRRNPQPTMQTRAGITYTGESRYEIYDLSTDEVLATVMLDSRLWWAPLPLVEELEGMGVLNALTAGPEQVPAVEDKQDRAEDEPQQGRPRSVGPVPENWVYMAENAITATARAWWARKVSDWCTE